MSMGDSSKAWLVAALWLSGCSFSASYSGHWYTGKPDPVRVSGPPPAAPSEVPLSCEGATVWVFGYWQWQAEAWVWTAGACREPQPAGSEWVGPVLHETDDGYELTPGHWAPSSSGGESESSAASKDDGKGHGAGVSISAGGSAASKPGKKPSKKPASQANAGGGEAQPHGGRQQPTRPPQRDRETVVASGAGAAAGTDARNATGSASDSSNSSNASSNANAGSHANAGSNTGASANAGSNAGSNANAGRGSNAGAAAGAGASASRPDHDVPGMFEAERGDVKEPGFSCKLASKQAKSGTRLVLKIKGVDGEAGVFFGKNRVEVLEQTKTRVHVLVPFGFSERTRVRLSYGDERVSCGDLDPKR